VVRASSDPASLSATASALRTLAAHLTAAAEDLRAPIEGPRLSAAQRRHVQEVCRAAADLARLAQHGGDLLNHTAYRQAREAHDIRSLEDRATASGLVRGEGGYGLAPGISGVAVPAVVAGRAEALAHAQSRVDELVAARQTADAAFIEKLRDLTAAATRVADALR